MVDLEKASKNMDVIFSNYLEVFYIMTLFIVRSYLLSLRSVPGNYLEVRIINRGSAVLFFVINFLRFLLVDISQFPIESYSVDK